MYYRSSYACHRRASIVDSLKSDLGVGVEDLPRSVPTIRCLFFVPSCIKLTRGLGLMDVLNLLSGLN